MSTSKLEQKKYLVVLIIFAMIIISAALIYRFNDTSFNEDRLIGSEHVHAKIKIFLENRDVLFSPQSNPEFFNANENIFIDKGDGTIIHRFSPNATLGMLFESMGMQFDKNCFILDNLNGDNERLGKKSFCIDESDEWNEYKFYVHKELNEEWNNYIPQDSDKILISFGHYDDQDFRIMFGTIGSFPPSLGISVG